MNDDLTLDTRIIQRQVAKGFRSPAEVAKSLESLPDVADQGEWFDPEAEPEAPAVVSSDADADADGEA